MSGHRSFDQLRAPTLERQERVAAAEQSLRTALHLRALRTRSGITQLQLAERMAVSQEFVSKLERGIDPRLSSITRYVKAMDGEVRIVVAMPNQEPVDLAAPVLETVTSGISFARCILPPSLATNQRPFSVATHADAIATILDGMNPHDAWAKTRGAGSGSCSARALSISSSSTSFPLRNASS